MRITSLHYVKRRSGGEVEVTFDDTSQLVIDPDLSVQFQLHTGMELSAEKLEELQAAQDKLAARRRLMRYIALRLKTVREAERYLRELKFGEDAVQSAIDAARALGYLSDERFAEAFAVTQDRAKKGPRAIRQELLSRGIEKNLAEEAVVPLDSPEAQRERAREAADKRAQMLLRTEPDTRKARIKLMQFLMRRGFDGDVCDEIARELLNATPES